MKKLAKLVTMTLLAVLPLSAFAAEEPVQNKNADAILNSAQISEKVAAQIKAAPGLAAEYVEAAIKNNSGLSSIKNKPSLSSEIVAKAIEQSPELAADIIKSAIEADPSNEQQIIAAAVASGVNPQNIIRASDEEIIAKVVSDIVAEPLKSAEIVQAAIEAYPDLAKQIYDAAVSTGADPDEMLVAAILGGASEAILSADTAAGDVIIAAVLGDAPQSTDFGGGTGSGSDDNASRN